LQRGWCLNAWPAALARSPPAILNRDQGSQYLTMEHTQERLDVGGGPSTTS
jgi:hypothetical protein